MDKPTTQARFAEKVGVSQPVISDLVRRGILTRGAPESQWLLEYTAHLRDVAAQWKSEEGIDRVKEAALLDRCKRALLEIELQEKHKNLWPTNAIAVALNQYNTNQKTRWLGLPSSYKSFCPHIAPRDIDILDNLVRENLIEQAHEQLSPDIRLMVERYWQELHAAAEANGKPVGGPVPVSKPRKQCHARKVENGAHPVPKKNNGRGQ